MAATGLDYVAVERVAVALDIDFAPALPWIQVLEDDQLTEWREKADQEKAAREAQHGR